MERMDRRAAGCAVWGYSQDEALAALQDAAEAYIEDMVEAGELSNHCGKVIVERPITIA